MLQTDRQAYESAYLDNLRLENENLKEYIRQRDEYNKSYLQVAEQQLNRKHAAIDAKMQDLMASLNMTGSLPDIRATPSVKGMPFSRDETPSVKGMPFSMEATPSMKEMQFAMDTTPSVKEVPFSMNATPSCLKGSTADNEIESIYKSLNEGMDRMRALGDLPRAVSPIVFKIEDIDHDD